MSEQDQETTGDEPRGATDSDVRRAIDRVHQQTQPDIQTRPAAPSPQERAAHDGTHRRLDSEQTHQQSPHRQAEGQTPHGQPQEQTPHGQAQSPHTQMQEQTGHRQAQDQSLHGQHPDEVTVQQALSSLFGVGLFVTPLTALGIGSVGVAYVIGAQVGAPIFGALIVSYAVLELAFGRLSRRNRHSE
jgi:hypothetical protein